SVTAALYSSLAARQERAAIRTLSGQLTRMQSQRQTLQQRNDVLVAKEKIIKLVLEGQPPPVPFWALAYLAEAVPPELVVTNFSVRQTNEAWSFHLAGTIQTTNQISPSSVSSSLAQLKANLGGPPFHLKMVSEARERQPEPAATAKPADNAIPEWVARVTNAETGKPEPTQVLEDHFSIEGTMR
ncbi:MAG TPA: hypothetical protein VNM37_18255, partial [Candidatus Dormibacteraeota bacterium]|nr:hypothetical protein [Candidatus Dormibacteraeota bacterium]